jgi:hypothetical protein
VYWVGPREDTTYELGQTSDGRVVVRYLPRGVAVGSSTPYLSVGTYPYPGAFAAIQALARQRGADVIRLRGGGLAVVDTSYPSSIHLAYPGSDYQIEVYDPSASTARRLVASGKVGAVG